MTDAEDPVLIRRARYGRLAEAGARIGYSLVLVSMVAFLIGFVANFPTAAVDVSVASLVAACVILPPAIIGRFAVRAAEREDRKAGRLAPPPGDTGAPGPIAR